MSTDGKQVVALGVGSGSPAILTLNTTNGAVQNLIAVYENSVSLPEIFTYGAILLDNFNPPNQNNFYISYLSSTKMHLVSLK